jgi:uncharacterized protein YkwD
MRALVKAIGGAVIAHHETQFYHMKKFLLLLLVTSMAGLMCAQELSQEEQKLYDLIMSYRKSRRLPVIPLSKSLTYVAQVHARDLTDNSPDKGRCNLHSWSDKGVWTECCYTDDHANAECVWSKPSELTSYTGYGYEIAAWSSEDISAEQALEMWKSSPGHHACMMNRGMWNRPWLAIGIGIYEGYALVWFGNEEEAKSKRK